MKRLFLTSSVGTPGVADSIYQKLNIITELKTAFITTPVELDSEQSDLSWLDEDRVALNQAGFTTFDYTITGKTLDQIQSDLQDIDVLYISGGNEFYFREVCATNNFDKYVKDFVASGKPYIGTSCGSIIAGSDMSASLQLNDLTSLERPVDTHGFGLVNFGILPHWGSDNFHDRYLNQESFNTMFNASPALIGLNNYQYIDVQNNSWAIIDIRNQ